MVRLSLEAFIAELTKLFLSSHTSGKSVFVSQKRVIPRGATAEAPQCLYRAVQGTRRISTMVGPNDAARFHPMYVTVLKSSTPGLKRAKKANKKKTKSKAAVAPA